MERIKISAMQSEHHDEIAVFIIEPVVAAIVVCQLTANNFYVPLRVENLKDYDY
jgi:adenosylmethionine-8-amino-7-oxononanoate aminotransferase